MRKQILAALIALLSLSSFNLAGAVTDISNSWLMTRSPDRPSSGVVFMEPTIYPGSTSYLKAFDARNPRSPWAESLMTSLCSSADAEPCKSADGLEYKAYLPKCDSQVITNCIEEFYVVSNEKKSMGQFDFYMPRSSPYHFEGNPNMNLPSGKSASIWKVPDLEEGDEPSTYAISVVLQHGVKSRSESGSLNFGSPSIEVTIDPVEIIKGLYSAPYVSSSNVGWTISGCLQQGCDEGSSSTLPSNIGYCSAVDSLKTPGTNGQMMPEGTCAKRVNQSSDVAYGISIKMSQPPEGWIHGRLVEPSFEIRRQADTAIWSVEGKPTTLPVLSGWISNSLAQEKLGSRLENLDRTSWQGPYSSGADALRVFKTWSPILGDRAQALQRRWSFRTLSGWERESNSPMISCFKSDSVAGMIVTNATVYQGIPPVWNASEATLDYQVAAPHFSVDGREFLGMYQMKLNTNFASCLYGIDSNKARATISVVSPEGDVRVATTSLVVTKDWLDFFAGGFTFSAPTIKVKLESSDLSSNASQTTDESVNRAEVNQSKSELSMAKDQTAATKVKKRTIKCQKGKAKLQVSGSKPICPKGYKRI